MPKFKTLSGRTKKESNTEANKLRRKEKWLRNRERWASDKEYQARQKKRQDILDRKARGEKINYSKEMGK